MFDKCDFSGYYINLRGQAKNWLFSVLNQIRWIYLYLVIQMAYSYQYSSFIFSLKKLVMTNVNVVLQSPGCLKSGYYPVKKAISFPNI